MDDQDFIDYALEEELQTEALKRALKKQDQLPQGVKLGNAVAAPHWTAFLASGLNEGFGRREQNAAESQLRALRGQQQTQVQDLYGQLGQAPLEDPVAENQRRMQIAGKLSMLPLSKGAGTQMLNQSFAFPEKMAQLKEQEASRKALQEAQLAARTEQQQRELQAQQERQAERLAATARENQMYRLTAATQEALRRAELENSRIRAERAGNRSGSGSGGHLPQYLTTRIQDNAEGIANFKRLSDEFKDEFAGDLTKRAQVAYGKAIGGSADEGTKSMTNWWRNQAFYDELPQRNQMFGQSLTEGEKQAWANATINPSMSPKDIRKNLDIRQNIMRSKRIALTANAERYAPGLADEMYKAYETEVEPPPATPPATPSASGFKVLKVR